MSHETAKAEVLRLYGRGKGRRAICQLLRLSRPFVYQVIAEHEGQVKRKLPYPWLPEDDEANLPGSESKYLPTPEEMQDLMARMRAGILVIPSQPGRSQRARLKESMSA